MARLFQHIQLSSSLRFRSQKEELSKHRQGEGREKSVDTQYMKDTMVNALLCWDFITISN